MERVNGARDRIDIAVPGIRRLQLKQSGLNWIWLLPAALIVAVLATQPVQAELLEKSRQVGDTTVRYKVVVPDGYDPAMTYPAILAFGGGPQTMNTVENVLNHNLRAEAEKRGYIVIAPAAPDDQLFFGRRRAHFPEFLKMMLAGLQNKQDNKFHIAGPSNGGIAAFHVAAANPEYFVSVTAFPGYMWEPSVKRSWRLFRRCVRIHVCGGERSLHVARGDESGGGMAAGQRNGRPVYRRGERPATPDGDAGRRQCGALVRQF